MSEKQIPERWRSEYDELCLLNNFNFPERRKKLIEELGTAESLVRDLARALQHYVDDPLVGPYETMEAIAALSLIPKEMLK